MCCLRLVLSDGNWIPVHKGSLSHLGLFQRKPELLRGDEYRLESDVTQEILTLFLARVWGDAGSHIVTHENWESLIFLCNEFEFGGFDADFRAVWAKLRDQMNQKDTQIQDLQRQVRALRSFCGLQKDMLLQFQACWAPRPMSKTCLIATLREQEAALGTEMVVLRQSSRDLYNTLDPGSSDEYQSSSIASGWIEIKFKEPVQVNGFKLISSRRQPNDNLKKFAVIFYDGNNERIMERCDFDDNFDTVSAKLVRIESRVDKFRGPHLFCLGGFELLSPDAAHTRGVFRSIFSQNRARVWDFFAVRARDYCGFTLHVPNKTEQVFTCGGDHEWLEIGFIHGRIVVSGYRMKGRSTHWTLRASNDRSAPIGNWTVIDSHSGATQSPHKSTICEFPCSSSTPFRFFRFVQEEKQRALILDYFDIDGTYVPDW